VCILLHLHVQEHLFYIRDIFIDALGSFADQMQFSDVKTIIVCTQLKVAYLLHHKETTNAGRLLEYGIVYSCN